MMRARWIVLAGALSLGPAAAADVPALLGEALARYREAQDMTEPAARQAAFADSARLFAAVAERGVRNPDLYANLGTAALQAERLGTAVLALRRALVADPGHPRATRNLRHARALLPGWVPVPPPPGPLDAFLPGRHRPPVDQRLAAAALAFLVGALALAAGIRYARRSARAVGFAALALWVVLLASVLAGRLGPPDRDAVIVADGAAAHASDSAQSPLRFPEPLPEGTEVTLTEDRGPWVRIALADGRDAWVRGSAIEKIRP